MEHTATLTTLDGRIVEVRIDDEGNTLLTIPLHGGDTVCIGLDPGEGGSLIDFLTS